MTDLGTLAQNFCDLIKTGQPDKAFYSASKEFQASATLDDFRQFVKDTGLADYQSISFGDAQEEGDQAGLQGLVKLADGRQLPILFFFKKGETNWQIHNITPAANPITRPELPDQATLNSTVHQYMSLFVLGNQQGDFTALYNLLADLWKVETTPEKLKAAFQSFLDQKIDLQFVLGAAPVISEPPVLDDQGFLLVKGYYPSPERHLVFDLVFAYQHPDWKLASLNVSSHKLNQHG